MIDNRPLVSSRTRIVLGDANVLYSRVLRDYLLYAAVEGLIEITWSSTILDEMAEHLIDNESTIEALKRVGAFKTAAVIADILSR